ncbi:MAG: hypothetical protein WCI51_13385 [Lentisphaerota bacterium]
MDLLKKNIALSMFIIKEWTTMSVTDVYARAIDFSARHLKDCQSGEIDTGWSAGNDVLNPFFDDSSCRSGENFIFNLRRTERKAPPKLIEAEVERQCRLYMSSHNVMFVPKQTRKDIKADVRQRLDSQAVPVPQWAQVIIDSNCRRVYVLTASATLLDAVILYCAKTFELKLEPVSPTFWAVDERLGNSGWGIGREFLTWCLWQSEKLALSNSLQFSIEAPLDFVYDEEQGFKVGIATDIAAKGDGAPVCNETQSALAGGKTLKKAVLNVVLDKSIWSGTFDAERFVWSSLTLPETESDTVAEIIGEKILLIAELYDLFKQRFHDFAVDYSQDDYQSRRVEWIRNRYMGSTTTEDNETN